MEKTGTSVFSGKTGGILMKVRILHKNNRYYLQQYVYEMDDPMIGGYYSWKFVRGEGFLGLQKKWFAHLGHAEDYAKTLLTNTEGYQLVKELE